MSLAGGLGLIGAGSMHPETLREHIHKCREACQGKPYGVNVPMLYPELDTIIDIIIAERVPVVVTSAGNPKTYTARLKEAGCKVLHVVASSKFALKSQEAGVDAVIAEGFEAGGAQWSRRDDDAMPHPRGGSSCNHPRGGRRRYLSRG